MAETETSSHDMDCKWRISNLSFRSMRRHEKLKSPELVGDRAEARQRGRGLLCGGFTFLPCVAACLFLGHIVAPCHSATLHSAQQPAAATADEHPIAAPPPLPSVRQSHGSTISAASNIGPPLLSAHHVVKKSVVTPHPTSPNLKAEQGHSPDEPPASGRTDKVDGAAGLRRYFLADAVSEKEKTVGSHGGEPLTMGAFAQLEDVARRMESVSRYTSHKVDTSKGEAEVASQPGKHDEDREIKKGRKAPVVPQVKLEPAFIVGAAQATKETATLYSNPGQNSTQSGMGPDTPPRRSSFSVVLALVVALLSVVAVLLLIPCLLHLARHGAVRLRGKGREPLKRRKKYSDGDEYDPTIANLADVEDGFEKAS